jgi:hypothetical protein
MNTTTEQNGFGFADSKEEILGVVCGLIDEAQREYVYDRRKHDRHSLAILVNATPIIDGRLGEPFKAVTHDISAGGLSLICNELIDDPILLLRFPGFNQPPLIVEVIRQTQIGPFWKVAGKFQTDL